MRGWASWTRFFFPYSFCSHFIEGGKFSFCQFAEKKNRGTGRKLAISWKSKLPSAAETGASYFQKMAQALPSSIMHSGIQNRNKEMALDPKIHHSLSIWILARFNSILASPNCESYPCVSFILVQYWTFLSIGSSAWRIRHDLSDYKKKIVISNKSIICERIDAFKRYHCVERKLFLWQILFYNWSLLLIGFQILHWIHLCSND